MSLTKWFFIQIPIIHDNISSQVADKRILVTTWFHPSSTTIFVHLFIKSVIQKVTIVTLNIIFSVATSIFSNMGPTTNLLLVKTSSSQNLSFKPVKDFLVLHKNLATCVHGPPHSRWTRRMWLDGGLRLSTCKHLRLIIF